MSYNKVRKEEQSKAFMKATVTSKRQVTIPVAICRQAHIVQGTQLDFQVSDDGALIIRPLTDDISKIKGIVKSKKRKPVSLREMKRAIRDGAEESMQ